MKQILKKVDDLFSKLWPETSFDEGVADLKRGLSKIDGDLNGRQRRKALAEFAVSVAQRFNEAGYPLDEAINDGFNLVRVNQSTYVGNGRKIRIAIIGGSYDMMHKGHLAQARAILSSGHVDEVWMSPANASIAGKQLTDPAHRSKMIKLAIQEEGVRGIKLFDYEIKHDLGGSTFHFLKQLLDDPEYKDRYIFSYVIGADIADSVPGWINGKFLVKKIPFIITARPGYALERNAWYTQYPHYIVESDKLLEASSTEAKRRLRGSKEFALELLHESVYTYIQDNDLYSAL